MTNITPISTINNRNLKTIIDFLAPFSLDAKTNFEVNSGILISMPQQILCGLDVNEMHGYIAGRTIARIESIRGSLIKINEGTLEMNTLGAEMFKQFCEDLSWSGKPYLTLSIPFTTETITINFVKLTGATRWSITNFWSNEVNLLQYALEGFMKRHNVNGSRLFGTNYVTEQMLRNPSEVDIEDIVRTINNENNECTVDQRNQAVIVYRELVAGVVMPDQDYPIEVMYDIGLLGNGRDLPVKLECQSHHHKALFGTYKVLPYSMKDGSSNMLLCQSCSTKERSDMLKAHPEYADHD